MTTSNEKVLAVTAVVERVGSYQDGATEGTTAKELRSALAETDVEVTDEQVDALVAAIEADPSSVDVAGILG